jgi:DNA repair protein RadC
MTNQAKLYRVPKYRLSLVREGTAGYAAPTVQCAENAARVIGAMLATECVENFVVVYLNGRNKVIGAEVVSRGGLHGCAITPAEIFRGAIVACAAGIVIGHNHPSGDPHPSRDDLDMTALAVKVGAEIGIPILDHVIVTRASDSEGRDTEGPHHAIRDSHPEIWN